MADLCVWDGQWWNSKQYPVFSAVTDVIKLQCFSCREENHWLYTLRNGLRMLQDFQWIQPWKFDLALFWYYSVFLFWWHKHGPHFSCIFPSARCCSYWNLTSQKSFDSRQDSLVQHVFPKTWLSIGAPWGELGSKGTALTEGTQRTILILSCVS